MEKLKIRNTSCGHFCRDGVGAIEIDGIGSLLIESLLWAVVREDMATSI